MTTPAVNLLIEVASFDKGGLEKVVLDSALRFDPDRFAVTVVCIGRSGHCAKLAEQRGIRVHTLPIWRRQAAYARILDRQQINISISHNSTFGYPLFKARGIPNVSFIHCMYAHLTPPMVMAFHEASRFVARYIAVSQNAAAYAVARLGIPASKVTTIPNGLILDEHETRSRTAPVLSRHDFGLAETDYVFLNVASYNLHKGHYLMADAMRHLLQQRQDVKILCIGNPVNRRRFNEFARYLRQEGLDRHILMPGYFPNVESFFKITDAFLLASFMEGWSIAMTEAMFHGKPLILTRTGAAEEVITNNDIGLLVDNEYGDILNLDARLLDELAYHPRTYRTAGQLASAMLEFADNQAYWENAGRLGTAKVRECCDFDRIVRRYEAVITEVLRENS